MSEDAPMNTGAVAWPDDFTAGILATAVLVLNAALGWWWADPAAGYVLACYATREVQEIAVGRARSVERKQPRPFPLDQSRIQVGASQPLFSKGEVCIVPPSAIVQSQ